MHSPDPIQKANDSILPQEKEWALLASKGDAVALANLYERYIDSVYRYMYLRVNNISEAEELTAETFTRAIELLSQDKYFLKDNSLRSWLFGIATNLVIDQYRKTGRGNVLMEDSVQDIEQPDDNDDILDSILREEEQDALWQLVKELSMEEQRIVVMRHIYELTYAEIAKQLGRSENACKQLHYRALKKLKLKAQEADLWKEILESENEQRQQ